MSDEVRTSDDLSIIGAGLPRTGTASLKVALEMLGFGPVHHGRECFLHLEQAIVFARALRGERINWRAVLHGYRSTMDAPTCLFYQEMMEVWPKAKVILSVRDSDEAWFNSHISTIGYDMTLLRYILIYPIRSSRLMFQLAEGIAQRWTEMYTAITPSMHSKHIEQVTRRVPKDRLLLFNVREGWKPLCAFLGVEEPSVPFPKINDTEEFRQHRRKAKLRGLAYWIGGLSLLIGCAHFLLRVYRLSV